MRASLLLSKKIYVLVSDSTWSKAFQHRFYRSPSRHQLGDDELGCDGERGIERHADVQSVRPPEAGGQVEEGGRARVRRLGA